jgi:hypothetical protein
MFLPAMFARLRSCHDAAILLSEGGREESPKDDDDVRNGNSEDRKECAKEVAACCLSIFPIGK